MMSNWIKRKETSIINVGSVPVGGGNPISIQSMTNTNTLDVLSTVTQINELLDKYKIDLSSNTKKINELEPSLSNIDDIQLTLKSIETQLILVDDSVQALNNYKKQLNQSILEIQTEISALKQLEQLEEPLN